MMKKCLLPKIRFPAFVKDGEWQKCVLNDIVIVHNGRDYKHLKAGTVPVYGTGGYMLSVDEALSNEDAVGIGRKGTIDKPQFLKAPFWTVDTLFFLTTKKQCDLQFFYQLAKIIDWKKYSVSAVLPTLTKKDIEQIEVCVPKILEEQKKIADLLSSVDAKVYATQEKLEELREQKKGMLQKFFPRNGENIPDYRFPEFKNNGKWQNGCLGDFTSFFKGKGISKSEISDDGNIPCIRYGELYTRYHEMVKDVKSHTALSPENLFFSQKNDVIIPATGETAEDISTASYLPLDGIALGGDINVVRSNCDGLFLAYYLSHIKKNDIAKIAHGFAIVHLHAEKLSKLKVQIPSLPEQKKIAQAILSVDELISLHMEKKDQLFQYKKGLVQRLFA